MLHRERPAGRRIQASGCHRLTVSVQDCQPQFIVNVLSIIRAQKGKFCDPVTFRDKHLLQHGICQDLRRDCFFPDHLAGDRPTFKALSGDQSESDRQYQKRRHGISAYFFTFIGTQLSK